MRPDRQPGWAEESFLELLLREAATGEFDELAAQLAAGGDGAAEDAQAVRQQALRVRALLERHQRRDNELTALYETANDLASLQDLDDVLGSIARRARRLLHCDVAYLSLVNDATTGTYIRVADGSVSPKLQDLQLDLDVGIGGVVARRAQSFQSAEYLTDPSLAHDRVVDAAVSEEGLVGIIGVPLLVSGRVIGVLFAADRRARTFTPDEAALLSSLATHAALAIEKTRLLQEATGALTQLGEAHDAIREHSRSVERAAEAHDRLTELALRGGGVSDVAESVVRVLGGSLVVVDAGGRTLAAVGAARDEVPAVATRAQTAEATQGAVQEGQWWLAPVCTGDTRLATLLLRPGAPLADADRRILERAAMVTALLLVWRRSVAEAELQGRGDLLRDVLTGAHAPSALVERARVLGVDVDGAWSVIVLRGGDRRQVLTAAAQAAPVSHGLVGEHDGDVVLLLPAAEEVSGLQAAASVVRSLASGAAQRVTAGVAGPALGVEGVRQAHQEAARCAGALAALGRTGEVADADHLGFLGVLLGDRRDPAGFLRDTLGPVLDYDARRGSDLVSTLTEYFAHDRGVGQVAAALHVHPNTVVQRLERVTRLLGAEWKSAPQVLEVQLALQLQRLQRASTAHP